jgi:hypothetical protein
MSIVVVHDCEGADEFLDLLSPRGRLFGGTEAVGSHTHLGDAWVFRGHADDDYQLVPSAFRGIDAFAKFDGRECTDNESQIRAEMDILRRFFNLADANGLPLPEDSQILRATIQSARWKRDVAAPSPLVAPRNRSALWRSNAFTRLDPQSTRRQLLCCSWGRKKSFHDQES